MECKIYTHKQPPSLMLCNNICIHNYFRLFKLNPIKSLFFIFIYFVCFFTFCVTTGTETKQSAPTLGFVYGAICTLSKATPTPSNKFTKNYDIECNLGILKCLDLDHNVQVSYIPLTFITIFYYRR